MSLPDEKSRIGLFGGSFDPIHNGHLSIATSAAKQFSLDRILDDRLVARATPGQNLSAEDGRHDRDQQTCYELSHRTLLSKSCFGRPHVTVPDTLGVSAGENTRFSLRKN